MIDGRRVLGIIPARGGSKGVPRKNIRIVAGRPLIAWTIEEAKKSKYIDRLILSSEDSEIIDVARKWGCDVPFTRPTEISQDNTPGVAVVLHAIESLPGYGYMVLLQPTSPLRKVEDIDGCIAKCAERRARTCVSVTKPEKSPYWIYRIANDHMEPIIDQKMEYARRQDLPKTFVLNGAVYVAQTETLALNRRLMDSETMAYEMPIERSIDIDTPLQLEIAEYLLARDSCRQRE